MEWTFEYRVPVLYALYIVEFLKFTCQQIHTNKLWTNKIELDWTELKNEKKTRTKNTQLTN